MRELHKVHKLAIELIRSGRISWNDAIEKAKEIYIMQEVKMVFETENIFIPKEALAFLMNDDINAIKELTEIILDAESVEFYCENMEMAIEEIQMKMES